MSEIDYNTPPVDVETFLKKIEEDEDIASEGRVDDPEKTLKAIFPKGRRFNPKQVVASGIVDLPGPVIQHPQKSPVFEDYPQQLGSVETKDNLPDPDNDPDKKPRGY